MLDGQERHIKCPTTKIIHNDLALTALIVKAVCNSHGSGLIDDAEDLQTRDDASILGCLALHIVEVRGDSDSDGDDHVCDFVPNVCLCGLLYLHEHHGVDLPRHLHVSCKLSNIRKHTHRQHVQSHAG